MSQLELVGIGLVPAVRQVFGGKVVEWVDAPWPPGTPGPPPELAVAAPDHIRRPLLAHPLGRVWGEATWTAPDLTVYTSPDRHARYIP